MAKAGPSRSAAEERRQDQEGGMEEEDGMGRGESKTSRAGKGKAERVKRPRAVPFVLLTRRADWKEKAAAREEDYEDGDDHEEEFEEEEHEEGDVFMEDIVDPREKKKAKGKERAKMRQPDWVLVVSNHLCYIQENRIDLAALRRIHATDALLNIGHAKYMPATPISKPAKLAMITRQGVP